MNEISCKLLVLGAGPGGYVAAIRAGQLGIDTVIVEQRRLGGTCLNVGCIPSKALIHVAEEYERVAFSAAGPSPLGISSASPKLDFGKAMGWKDGIVGRLNNGVASLLKRANVKIVGGTGRFRDGKTIEVSTETGLQVIRADTIVIATGSQANELSFLPFGGPVISSTEALALPEVPKTLAIVGAGYIGLELSIAFAKLGTRVSVVEADATILPQYDRELTAPVARRMRELGIEMMLSARARGLGPKGSGLQVELAGGVSRLIDAERILVTVGRRPNTAGWGLEELALDLTGSHLRIDDQCRTSMRGVYAIGDVTGEPMLAHRAMAQGEMVAELVAGHPRSWDKRAIPAICFTDPEIVSVGLSPDAARRARIKIKTGQFPFSANARSMTKGAEPGFVRIVARADDDLVLGIQAVGHGVSELSSSFGLAMEMGGRLEDIAGTIHAHPTGGEAFAEAALRILGRALHI